MKDILVIFFILCSATLFSQAYRPPAITEQSVQKEIERIDLFDGVKDEALCLDNDEDSRRANHTFFELLPEIDSVTNSEALPPFTRQNLRSNLVFMLREIDEENVDRIGFWEGKVKNLSVGLQGIMDGNLMQVLLLDVPVSISNFAFYQFEPEAEKFLLSAAKSHPVETLKAYESYEKRPYSLVAVLLAGKQSPEALRGYLGTPSPIADVAENSTDPAIDAIVRLHKVFKGKTRAYALIELIARQDMPLQYADELAADDTEFFHQLMKVRSIPEAYGLHTVDRELNRLSLEVVRKVNEDHDFNDAIRFATVEGYSAEELYTLTVYTQSEIFTSTFNGFFDRMMKDLGDRSAYSLLDSLNFYRFRTFIKMAAGFNKLEPFLATMSYAERESVLSRFASGLEEKRGDLEAAVDVADALGSIRDSLSAAILNTTLKHEMKRVYMEGNKEGVVIYSLLNGLFLDTTLYDSNWVAKLNNQYAISNIDHIPNSELFNKDSIHVQWHFFYDDKDGKASFATFLSAFRSEEWKLEEETNYVKISGGKDWRVVIFANKPEAEYDGQDQLSALLTDSGWTPHVIVHRGHSYYADLTIEKIPEEAKVVMLGSCGGYHNLSLVLDRSPGIHIISSKQIGMMAVNNPLLRKIADEVREGKGLYWPLIWKDLEERFGTGTKAGDSFMDYIPPHRNLGAIFIQAYNNIMAAS